MTVLTWEILPAMVANNLTILHAGRRVVGHVEERLYIGPANVAGYRAYSHLNGRAKDGTHEECKAWLECSITEWFDGAMAIPQAKS